MSFTSLGLSAPILDAVAEQGYETPSPIQAKAIPAVLEGRDVMAAAQTGTGKTAGFTLPILERLAAGTRAPGKQVRALILTPTRELAAQIGANIEAYGKHLPLRSAVVFGGVKINPQIAKLRGGVDILVATPGRLLDLHGQKAVNFDALDVLVLDEADRMLSMGFIPDVKRIIRHTPKKEERQTFLFSATFTGDILQLASQWTLDPAHVEIAVTVDNAANIDQRVYMVGDAEKQRLLVKLLQQESFDRVMVFGNRRDLVRKLDDLLRKAGINVAMLSGDVPQNQRIETLEKFRAGKIQVLVATDVAGRGIHIEDVSHVINYTLPEDPEDYVHRIGRTGRAGAKGVSISFVGEEDAFSLPEIERYIDDKLPCEHPPEGLL